MEIAKIRVDGTMASVVSRIPIPSGLTGGTIAVAYAPGIWDDLTTTIVFKGVVTKDVLTNDTIVEIPHEVIADAGKHLEIGFYGVDANNNLIVPTLWCNLGRVLPGTDPSGDTTTDPSLPVWAQLDDKIDDLREQLENITPGVNPEPGGDIDLTGYATEEWVEKGFQTKGDYLPAAELPTAVNAALAQAKESGEFDGKDGKDGKDGQNGQDGKTPVKGQDYYTDADKAEMVNAVLAALPVYNGEVESV